MLVQMDLMFEVVCFKMSPGANHSNENVLDLHLNAKVKLLFI